MDSVAGRQTGDVVTAGNPNTRWFTNDMQPPIKTLSKIAEYLDVNVSELLGKSK